MRHLVIVARDRPELFDSLTHRFAADPGVDVMVDRRLGPGHTVVSLAALPDDRRQNPEGVEARLWVEGYVVVRLA
ncbi:MAG: hypothetical protein HYR51_07060 [Candidatus Rokubacteria bacterium]|nr:hypothetical protein [Candidatus Rokubacteria bacterium]